MAGLIGVINLDTVGRLGNDRVSVLGAGSASEWQHIFRGSGFVTGVEGRIVMDQAEGSDQMSFIRKGVPAIQIFTGANADYHRPTDTIDKIDTAGLVKVAAYTREGIAYLGERETPLTNTIKPTPTTATGAAAPTAPAGQARRASFGSVPDFAFTGPGVRLSGVTPGSPAAMAGMKEGDVITRLDGKDIQDLRAFSEFLRGAVAGQSVAVTLLRDGKTLDIRVTLVER
jgi:membrane-associated protease RseP (regulator of RpoE activity)